MRKLKSTAVLTLIAVIAIIGAAIAPARTETTISMLQYKGADGDYELVFTITNIPSRVITVGVEKRTPTSRKQADSLPLIVRMFFADESGTVNGNIYLGALDELFDYYFVVIAGSERLEALITDSTGARKTNIQNGTRDAADYELIELKEHIATAWELFHDTHVSEDGKISSEGKSISSTEWWATWEAINEFRFAINTAQESFDSQYDSSKGIYVTEGQLIDITIFVSDIPEGTNLFEISYNPREVEFVKLSDADVGAVELLSHNSTHGFIVFSYNSNANYFSEIICNVYFTGITAAENAFTKINTRSLN
jgi:hypothetical protein